MLKDIRDSKRIANLVCESSSKSVDAKSDNEKGEKSLILLKSDVNGDANKSSLLTFGDKNDEFFKMSTYILSIHYWPELLDDKFKIPEAFKPVFDHYEK